MTTDGPEDQDQGAPTTESPGAAPSAPPDPIGELREKITTATEDFLKARLGLEEGADGSLHLPERGVFVRSTTTIRVP